MSANLDLVRSVYADWERGEFNPRPAWADPRIEFEVPGGPEPSTRFGMDAAPGVEGFVKLWENLRLDAEGYRELDDGSVFVVCRMRGRGKGSGVEVDQRRASLFDLRDGKLTRLALYWTATAPLLTSA